MKITDIKAPAYVNLKVPGVVGYLFTSNLKWDGVKLEKPAHDMFCMRWGWIPANVTVAETLMDTWEQMETGSLKLDHPYGDPK